MSFDVLEQRMPIVDVLEALQDIPGFDEKLAQEALLNFKRFQDEALESSGERLKYASYLVNSYYHDLREMENIKEGRQPWCMLASRASASGYLDLVKDTAPVDDLDYCARMYSAFASISHLSLCGGDNWTHFEDDMDALMNCGIEESVIVSRVTQFLDEQGIDYPENPSIKAFAFSDIFHKESVIVNLLSYGDYILNIKQELNSIGVPLENIEQDSR